MSRRNFLKNVGLLSALLLLGACSENPVDETPVSPVESRVEEKLVLSSKHAVSGSLLVRFDADAARLIEHTTGTVTRAGGVATRSGLAGFDEVLAGIGVKSLQRLFPVDPRHEERMREAGLHRWYVVGFDEGADLDRVARDMARVAEVDKVEFNQQLLHVSCGKAVPLTDAPQTTLATRADAGSFNDPYLALQWHFINGGNAAIYSKIKAGADVNCAEAWPICAGDPRVVVAVVDDCVQWDHPDLAPNMWTNAGEMADGTDSDGNGFADDLHGYNFVDDTPLAVSTKGDGVDHGTHIAGTIAAVNGNGQGVCGIAGGSGKNDGVRIMSCQIFHNDKGGTAAITARAILYAANNGASILQCSFGYKGGAITSDSDYEKSSTAEKEAIDYFVHTQNCEAVDGGIVIFAAGNDSYALSSYPGAYRNYISVTSMSCDYTPAYYTNYGPGCNIAAPGGDFCQSYLENRKNGSQVLSTLNDSQYGYMQGTSMACPHVSGVAALGLSYALQQGKTFTQKEFVSMLLTSVNDINRYCVGTKQYVSDAGTIATLDLSRFKNNMGSGYVDAFQLLMQIRGITCLPVPVGEQVLLDLTPYLGDGCLNMRVVKAEIDAADRTRLGIVSEPVIFSNRIILTCTQSGSAIIRVTLLAGKGNDNGVSGLTITKEYALIARVFRPQNDGWF